MSSAAPAEVTVESGEIAEPARKLSVQQNENDPAAGWMTLRF